MHIQKVLLFLLKQIHTIFQLNLSKNELIAASASVSTEGMLGISGFLRGNISLNTTISQTNYVVIRLPINIVQQEFAYTRALQQILLLDTKILLRKILQNAFCSCHPTLEHRILTEQALAEFGERWDLQYSTIEKS